MAEIVIVHRQQRWSVFKKTTNSTKWAIETIGEGLHYELASHGIDSVIVEPGIFKTEILGKVSSPDKTDINEEYAEFNKYQEVMFAKALADIEPDNGPRPVWIANAIKELVDMPAGERPIRTVVGEALTGGIRELNQAQIIAQRQHLEDAGLGAWNKN